MIEKVIDNRGGLYGRLTEIIQILATKRKGFPQNILVKQAGLEDYWLHTQNSKTWLSWAGYAFEAICLKHIGQIKTALGISGIITFQTSWRSSRENGGVEIDLLIERADGCINFCKIKFSRGLFIITKNYAESLKKKKQRFIEETNIQKAVFATLITPHGIKENVHYQTEIDKQLTIDDLFS